MPQRRASASQHCRASLTPVTSAHPQAARSLHQPRALAIAAQCALLAGFSAGAMGLLLAPEFAHAQAAQGTQASQPAQVKNYNIPASSLAEALRAFASAAGVELTVDGTLVQGRQSHGLNGSYSVAGGFDALLSGHSLQAVRQGNGSYALRVVETLPEVTVTAPGGGGGVATLPEVVVTARPLGITEGTGSYTTDSTSAATGMNLSLRETPQSVSVVTRQRMDDQQLHSIADAAEQTTGILVQRAGPNIGGTRLLYSRGYVVRSYQVDGMPTSAQGWSDSQRNYGSLDTAFYDSFTVVRGATGLLNGAGDPSANISLTRKRPTHDFQASLEAGIGRWDQQRIVADFAGPLNVTGTLRGRFIGAYDESKSWISRYEGDRHAIYGVVDADLSDQTKLSFMLEHGKEKSNVGDSGGGYAVLYSDGTPTPFSRHDNIAPEWGKWDTQRTVVAAELQHQFNDDWQGQVRVSHTEREQLYIRATNFSNIQPDNTATAMAIRSRYDTKVDDLTAKLSGQYSLFKREHDLSVGLNISKLTWSYPENHAALVLQPVAITNGYAWGQEPDWDSISFSSTDYIKNNQRGLYASSRIRMSDDLSLIVGGRWSNWDYFQMSAAGVALDDRKYRGEFTPYLGVVYDLTDKISMYSSYTHIFNPQSAKDVEGRLLNPEEGKNYEVGLKGRWFDGRINAGLALFETRKDNLAVTDVGNYTPDGAQAYTAEDNTKTRGWELDFSGELLPGWNIYTGYSRTISRASDGTRLNTEIPIHQVKLFTTYKPQDLSRLTVGGGVNWQSKIYSTSYDVYDLRSYITQRSYVVASLMARYEFSENISMAVNVNNLFNKNYRTSATHHNYGAERNIYASLKYSF